MTKERKEYLEDVLLNLVGVNEEALDLAIGLLGANEETYTSILYHYTAYRDFETYMESEWDEEEEEEED